MLTKNKLENEKIFFRKIRLDSLIKTIIKSLKVITDAKDIKIECKNCKNIKRIEIFGDEEKIEKLFLNILRNGIKYTNPNGKIIISVKMTQSNVNISIADNGIGIPKKDIPFIFERFYRIDQSRSRSEGGTGLGLSICKWIAEIHGGKIKVESILGKGSKFTVCLPYNLKNKNS